MEIEKYYYQPTQDEKRHKLTSKVRNFTIKQFQEPKNNQNNWNKKIKADNLTTKKKKKLHQHKAEWLPFCCSWAQADKPWRIQETSLMVNPSSSATRSNQPKKKMRISATTRNRTGYERKWDSHSIQSKSWENRL